MAEAVSATEIEDVLSSIRRLVAQDLKPADRAKLAAVVDISQKLVLSPESRIEDRPEAAAKFVTVRRPSRRAAFPAIDDVLSSVDGKQGADMHKPAAEMPQAQAEDFVLNPQARLSDFAPQEFGLDQPPAPPMPDLDWTEEPENMDDLPPDEPAAQSFDGTIEPDAAWADAAEARVIAELSGESFDPPPDTAAYDEPSFARQARVAPEVMFDDAQLRNLVRTIFREEMAGPMGERITRNIRKLVRAEVGRMLAAQDLE